MARDTQPAASAGTETSAPAPAKPDEPKAAPFVPSYRVGTIADGEKAGTRSVLVATKDGKEKPVDEDGGKAPAEAWAELRGDVDPVLTPERPRAAHTEYRRHRYLAAMVQWGGAWKIAGDKLVREGEWSPGAPGREMTLAEYDFFVRLGTDGTIGTGSGIPPVKAKE